MHTNPSPGLRDLSIIFITGILCVSRCFAIEPQQKRISKTTSQPEKETLVYIGFVGRKIIKPLHRTEYVVEVYKLSPDIIMQLNKLRFSLDRYHCKSLQKQQLLLMSLKDSCRVYRINNPVKYKYFYPHGLKKGMVIPENEFSHWDFTEQIDLNQPVDRLPAKPISFADLTREPIPEPLQPATKEKENKNPNGLRWENGNPTIQYIVPGIRTYVFYPWDTYEILDTKTPYNPSFDHFIDSLFLHLSDFSEYLGAQRINLELYDQPLAANFYASMYIHYVDSIVNLLKRNPLIKQGEYENFIINTSEIVTNRFKYGANILLWQGIRKNLLDCDNTAFLVYDIGKKLGFEVSVVFVPGHAFVITGNYVYETTRLEYHPKKLVNEHYPTIHMISSDPKLIHALLSINEIALDLIEKNEQLKAADFRKILLRYFPGMKHPY